MRWFEIQVSRLWFFTVLIDKIEVNQTSKLGKWRSVLPLWFTHLLLYELFTAEQEVSQIIPRQRSSINIMDPLLPVKVFPVKTLYGSGDIGQRHALFLLAFTGCLIMYASRVILSISMVAMTVPIVRNYSVPSNGSQEDTCLDPGVGATTISATLNDSFVRNKSRVTDLQRVLYT